MSDAHRSSPVSAPINIFFWAAYGALMGFTFAWIVEWFAALPTLRVGIWGLGTIIGFNIGAYMALRHIACRMLQPTVSALPTNAARVCPNKTSEIVYSPDIHGDASSLAPQR